MKFPGREIAAEEMKSGAVEVVKDSVGILYEWDTGEAMGRFLAELKKGRIFGRKCRACGRILVPPRAFCESDFIPTDEWVRVKETGRVKTYSVSYIKADASRTRRPTIVAVIELDGASEGMGFLHILRRVRPDGVKIGMRVKAVWKPREKRVGSITDIAYFEPLR